MKEEYASMIGEFLELRKTMLDDLESINQRLIEDPLNECFIRVYVRTLYSFIETTCYIWKRAAYLKDRYDIASGKIANSRLSEGDISMIFEESFYVAENGKVKVRPNYIESTRNFRFSLRIFAETHGLNYAHIFNEKGWDAYREGLKIRNRLTHPKANADLIITDEEHEIIYEVFDWFFGAIIFLGTDRGIIH